MKKFNVILERNGKFQPYDIMLSLVLEYKDRRKKNKKNIPKTKKEFEEFIISYSKYYWWSRSEYEIMLLDWPGEAHYEKWDVHQQVMMNIDVITDILIENVVKTKTGIEEIKEGD